MLASGQPCMLFIVSTRSIQCLLVRAPSVGPPRNSRISGWARIHCIVSISARASSGRSANWLCAPVGEHQVHLPQAAQQRERVGVDGLVVALLVELVRRVQQRVERLEELASPIHHADGGGTARPTQRQAVLVPVLGGPPADRQPALLVLGEPPEQVAQRQQRVEVEAGQGVVPPPIRRFWNRARMWFIVCASPPSSIQ